MSEVLFVTFVIFLASCWIIVMAGDFLLDRKKAKEENDLLLLKCDTMIEKILNSQFRILETGNKNADFKKKSDDLKKQNNKLLCFYKTKSTAAAIQEFYDDLFREQIFVSILNSEIKSTYKKDIGKKGIISRINSIIKDSEKNL